MAASKDTYKDIGNFLNSISISYNFQVAKTNPFGRPASGNFNGREYRMQLININYDTSMLYKEKLIDELKKNKDITNINYNQISPNSSKYSSISFSFNGEYYDVVIAKGANQGEKFEKKVVTDLENFFLRNQVNEDYEKLVSKLSKANIEFSKNEIKEVKQRTGSTKKENVPIASLGEVIGDIVITDTSNKKWFISLKDVNGDTFSSYSGAASLMQRDGTLDPNSDGANFLSVFGVDLNEVQQGYDIRGKKNILRNALPKNRPDSSKIKSIFERAWGMNYFYVRKTTNDWKVFWLDDRKLNQLTQNIIVKKIKYPSASSKQIAIECGNSYAEYLIEIRNSKGGEYPNDIKFRAKKVSMD